MTDLDLLKQALEPDKRLVEEPMHTSPQWRGRVFGVDVMDVTQPDGRTGRRELVRHNGGCGVVAVRDDGRMCLVRQWRVALGRMTVEIPAGRIERGEDAADAAARELVEETGLVSTKPLEQVATSYGSPGFTDECTRIFYADQLEQGPARPDDDEFVGVLWADPAAVVQASLDGLVVDAKTIIGAYVATSRQRPC